MTSQRRFAGSPRFLTLQHAHAVRAENAEARGEAAEDAPLPAAGVKKPDKSYEQLFSYFAPALSGGTYNVTTVQTVSAGGKSLTRTPTTTKTFEVEAPRYVLPEGAVHSVYPPDGTEAPAETLPHVLFTDPYLPWERLPVDESNDRERAPWLALLTFSESELILNGDELNPNNAMFKGTALGTEAKRSNKQIMQIANLAINMPISDIQKISDISSPIPKTQDLSVRGDVIFIQPGLFKLLATDFLPDGTPDPQQKSTSVTRYMYLAHVRYSNAEGMEATGDDGLYSSVFSHRTGPLQSDHSTRTVVHLVSLEGWPGPDLGSWDASRVALSSLYSWSYTILPTGAKNVAEEFENLGSGLSTLRIPDERLTQLDALPDSSRIKKRLQDGYTLAKYLTKTGEETAAIIRGPLTPTRPPEKLSETWESLSFSGSNLQIFDKQLGLMDITYSTAWTLGKTLALADQVFTTSLARIRADSDAYALNEAKKQRLEEMDGWKSRRIVIAALTEMIPKIHNIANGQAGEPDASQNLQSFRAPDKDPVDLSRSDPLVNVNSEDAAATKMMSLAASADDPNSTYFNELNKPSSTDWMVVLAWILDKLYLFNIPAQHLLPDPSLLPNESLRFFYIDPHWTDAFIDGALSLANHISRTDDVLRRKMKEVINDYSKTVDPSLGYRPQVPKYGCLLRSDLIRSFPDLHVTAPFPTIHVAVDDGSQKRAPILRHERLSEDTLLCLFDRVPGSQELATLTFTQPAHQQYFVVGKKITSTTLETVYKRVHSQIPRKGEQAYGDYPEVVLPAQNDPQNPIENRFFIWGDNNEARFLNLAALNADVLKKLENDPHKPFIDTISTSALIDYQLGCPVYQLTLLADGVSLVDSLPNDSLPNDSEPRLLRMLEPQSPESGATDTNTAKLSNTTPLNAKDKAQLFKLPSPGPPQHPAIISSRFVLDPLPNLTPTAIAVASAVGDHAPPIIQWNVYPIDAYNKVVPSNSGYPVDLVFSIKIPDARKRTEDLIKIKLEIPFGSTDDRINGKKPLLAHYNGLGPVMLSNLRWNVVMSQREDNGYYDLTLLPRSTRGKRPRVPVKRASDCSFLLPMVDVNKYTKTTWVEIAQTVTYVQYPDLFSTQQIILRPT